MKAERGVPGPRSWNKGTGRASEEFFARQGRRSLPKAVMLNLVRTNVQLTKKINPTSEKELLLIALLLGEGSRRKADELSSPESSSQNRLLLLLLRLLLLHVPLHSFLHALFVLGLQLLQLRLLIGGEQLVELVVSARFLHRDLLLHLRFLRRKRLDLRLVVIALDILADLEVDLAILLEQWTHQRMLFLHDRLGLCLLIIGQVKLGEKEVVHPTRSESMGMTMHWRWRRSVFCGLGLRDYGTEQYG